MELEMSVSSHTQVSQISEKLNSMLETAQTQAQTQGQLEKKQDQDEIGKFYNSHSIPCGSNICVSDRRLDVLKHWINPPRWLRTHEHAQRRRSPKTSEWFLEHSKVKSWIGKIEKKGKSRHYNFLSIHGKHQLRSAETFFIPELTNRRKTRLWKNYPLYRPCGFPPQQSRNQLL
jgi:hypothetical protein